MFPSNDVTTENSYRQACQGTTCRSRLYRRWHGCGLLGLSSLGVLVLAKGKVHDSSTWLDFEIRLSRVVTVGGYNVITQVGGRYCWGNIDIMWLCEWKNMKLCGAKKNSLTWCDLDWWWRRSFKNIGQVKLLFDKPFIPHHSSSPAAFCGFAHDLKSIVHIEGSFPPHCWSFLLFFWGSAMTWPETSNPIRLSLVGLGTGGSFGIPSDCQVHHLLGFLPLPWWRHRSAFLGCGGRKLWDAQRKGEF